MDAPTLGQPVQHRGDRGFGWVVGLVVRDGTPHVAVSTAGLNNFNRDHDRVIPLDDFHEQYEERREPRTVWIGVSHRTSGCIFDKELEARVWRDAADGRSIAKFIEEVD